MVEIVKRIVADRGEAILADPQMLRAVFADYAMGQPKPERAAFCLCIEIGAYKELKRARDGEDLRLRMDGLAKELSENYGIDADMSSAALDILAKVIFGASNRVPTAENPVLSPTDGGLSTQARASIEPRGSSASLVEVVRQIIADRGEDILANPELLRPLFNIYAKNAPQQDRKAFGRCIEIGAYHFFQRAVDADDRGRLKAAIADELSDYHNSDRSVFLAALNVLEAALFEHAQAGPTHNDQSHSLPCSADIGFPGNPA